jgi:hypothetical protein
MGQYSTFAEAITSAVPAFMGILKIKSDEKAEAARVGFEERKLAADKEERRLDREAAAREAQSNRLLQERTIANSIFQMWQERDVARSKEAMEFATMRNGVFTETNAENLQVVNAAGIEISQLENKYLGQTNEYSNLYAQANKHLIDPSSPAIKQVATQGGVTIETVDEALLLKSSIMKGSPLKRDVWDKIDPNVKSEFFQNQEGKFIQTINTYMERAGMAVYGGNMTAPQAEKELRTLLLSLFTDDGSADKVKSIVQTIDISGLANSYSGLVRAKADMLNTVNNRKLVEARRTAYSKHYYTIPSLMSQATTPEALLKARTALAALYTNEEATARLELGAHETMDWRSIASEYGAQMGDDRSMGMPVLQELYKRKRSGMLFKQYKKIEQGVPEVRK